MKDPNTNFKIRLTLYGWIGFKIHLPFIKMLGLYDLQLNMLEDFKSNPLKYFMVKER